ncbi:MAG: acylphosphatase [Rhodospirillaceae bacterium]|nr:acylphosphatase [Rhodospirillaceae bacterium]
MAEPHAVRLLISGRVQGVGFRAWAARKAADLGLSGWVRNLTDGRVEALAHGPAVDVARFIQLCHRGPVMARVDLVDAQSAGTASPGPGFEQRPTADPA